MNAKLIEATVGKESERARLMQVVELLPELKSIAGEFFEVESVEFESDPEVDFNYFNICVKASGDVKDICKRRQQWHRRTDDILGDNADLVGLLIEVV